MRGQHVAKVTVSIPRDLLNFADHVAKEQAISRSEVFAKLLKKEEKARLDALMAEGYKEMAEENRKLAEEAFPAASEMIRKHTQWDERAHS